MKLARYIITVLVLLALIGGGVFLSKFPSVQNTVALATTVKPEPFTELYFNDHEKLIKRVDPNQAQSFSFTIHNVEYKTMSYPYEVYVEDSNGKKAEIIKDIVKLSPDQTKTIPVYFELLQPITRAKVVVNLDNKNQEIHYWIEPLTKPTIVVTPSAQPTL